MLKLRSVNVFDLLEALSEDVLNEKTQVINRTYNKVESYIDETDDNYSITMIAPGIKKEKLSIIEDNGIIKIKYDDDEKVKYKLSSFEKSYKCNKPIKSDEINADYTDGILTITIPKNRKNTVNINIK